MTEMLYEAILTVEDFLQLPESNLPTEFIHGEVIMAPAPLLLHQSTLLRTSSIIQSKVSNNSQLFIAPTDLKLGNNVVQPDLLWISESNTECIPVDGKYWQGAPDLVVEILSAGTAKRDRGEKYTLYEKHGVKEYWLVDPANETLEVYVLQDGKFIQHAIADAEDTFTSPILKNATVETKTIFG